jgi:4-amino-4-deoxy-L-arabinose transferase-like glycosyltransferase
MTKGPVGLILPGFILGTYFLLCARGKNITSFLRLGLGSLLVAIVALPWFVVEIAITHGAYFREFIMRENFARFTSVVDSHKGHWWYHLAAIFGGLFPWSTLLPQAIATIAKDIIGKPIAEFQSINNPLLNNTKIVIQKIVDNCKHLTLPNETLLFSLIWAASTIVFFSASVSKLLPYTLPAFPALAIIIAHQWQIFMENGRNRSMTVYCALIFSLFAGAVVCAPIALRYLRNAPPDLTSLLVVSVSILSLYFLLALFLAVIKRQKLASFVLFASAIVFSLIVTPKILEQVSQFWEGSVVDYAEFARLSKKPLIVYRLRKPAMPFYYGARVQQANNKEELKNALGLQEQCYLITNCKDLVFLKALGCKTIATDSNFAFVLCPGKHNSDNFVWN